MTQYTELQLIRCSNDAYAFYRAAELMCQDIEKENYRANSIAWVSSMDILMCNLGMAFELNLKLLLLKHEYKVEPVHPLRKLYERLPFKVREELNTLYKSSNGRWCIKAFIHTKTPEPPNVSPDERPLNTLEQFLGWLDYIGMYARRYAFENFDRGRLHYYFDPPTPLFNLWARLDHYTKTFEKNNQS